MEETQKFSLNLPRLPVKRGFSWSRPQALGGLCRRDTRALRRVLLPLISKAATGVEPCAYRSGDTL